MVNKEWEDEHFERGLTEIYAFKNHETKIDNVIQYIRFLL